MRNHSRWQFRFALKFIPMLLTATVILVHSYVYATTTTPEEKGLNIVIEADKRDSGYGDSRADLNMILRTKNGRQTTRIMRNKILEQAGDGDKSLIIFDNPQDVRGSAFLSFTHKRGNDDQWLYLPALKRVKRIASSNKSGPFMGSEFSYEDISSQEVEKYTYRFLGNEILDGQDHFVIERYPLDPKSGYSKQKLWLDIHELRTIKVESYDRKQAKLKTLILTDYQLHLNKFWRANSWLMVNHITGKSTELQFSNWRFKNGYTDQDFTKNSLARAK